MTAPLLLRPEETALIVVDVQERMMPAIAGAEEVLEGCRRLIKGFRLLGLPIVITEQYPKGLGHTLAPLLEAAGDSPVVEKRTFSSCGGEGFHGRIAAHHQLLLCGVEAHVCVCQTAQEALEAGHQVHIARDAVGSRAAINRDAGLAKMERAGAVPSSVEIALFELLRTSTHPQFKAISQLIR